LRQLLGKLLGLGSIFLLDGLGELVHRFGHLGIDGLGSLHGAAEQPGGQDQPGNAKQGQAYVHPHEFLLSYLEIGHWALAIAHYFFFSRNFLWQSSQVLSSLTMVAKAALPSFLPWMFSASSRDAAFISVIQFCQAFSSVGGLYSAARSAITADW